MNTLDDVSGFEIYGEEWRKVGRRITIIPFTKRGIPNGIFQAFLPGCNVHISEVQSLPCSFPKRPLSGQLLTGPLLKFARQIKSENNIKKFHIVCLVVDDDITREDLNYVFGVALLTDRIAVVSTARLAGVTRLWKVIAHEIGHALQFAHCGNKKCIMFGSQCLEDLDTKECDMCTRCLNALHRIYGIKMKSTRKLFIEQKLSVTRSDEEMESL